MLPALDPGADEREVDPAPCQRHHDEAELDEQRLPVRRLPEIGDGGQALDGDDGAGDDEHADEHDRDALGPEEGRLPEAGRERPDDAWKDEDDESRRRERASHGVPPARSERWPRIGAMSRSAKSITASARQVAAEPNAHTARRGLNAAPSGNTARDDEHPPDQVVEKCRAGGRASGLSQPWASSAGRSRSSTTPGATTSANTSPTTITSSGGWTSQSHRSFPSG